ncbi:Uncharacterised protein [Mycolicibacterium vanbaalenii]|uniref:Uncharacterized protein n=1 Tax=Mycolicibacterium vanbaalenii TaxID=110539 RepID=A0A5S9R9L3_MYCVN|nr:hypothetical protein [Mycolicibacterium vanbaalenii]CAA0134543.1 Uncharacterised protein [Mycolicibacterium vanbaalenii]
MTAPDCLDPAIDVVNTVMDAMRAAFRADSDCPPVGGGIDVVRMFAGDGALPAWDPQLAQEAMFLWVRVDRRYRSRTPDFPAAFVGDGPCDNADAFAVLAVEVGVARCTSMDSECNWPLLAEEAQISLDDSWRLERVMRAVRCLRSKERAVATDTVAPVGPEGPEGGVVAWTGMAYVQI